MYMYCYMYQFDSHFSFKPFMRVKATFTTNKSLVYLCRDSDHACL